MKQLLILIAIVSFLSCRAQKPQSDTSIKRPDKISCKCPCHDGVAGFFHCWTNCCKWPNEPRIAPKKEKQII